ncbi:MAG: hypothetical protein HXY23_08695 [Parvularculaceae bacterium]|nr:hypothetical protein [Parvularculaceae bacterium]
MRQNAKPGGSALALLGAVLLAAAPARAEISLSPLRQVITPAEPVATYQISNPSRRIIEGRVSWVDLRATETAYETATPSERARSSAAPYLTIWPATFRLEPGARMTLVVRVKQGVSIPKGERRSHLLIETAATRTPLRRTSGSLELDIDLGVTTPVILRSGPVTPAAHLGDTKLLRAADGRLEVETHLHPDAPVTAYGRLLARMETPGSAPKVIGRLDNVAVYPEAARRRFIVPLDVSQLPGGTLDLAFEGSAEAEGVAFANRRFEIAPSTAP